MKGIPKDTPVALVVDHQADGFIVKAGMTGVMCDIATTPDDDGDRYHVRFDIGGVILVVPAVAVQPCDPKLGRALILNNARISRDEIRQIFTDVASWNMNSKARANGAAPIDPDPDGQLRRMLRSLESFIEREESHAKEAVN